MPQAERDKMNAAARRAQMTLGQWLIEAARHRIERERGLVVDGLAPPANSHGELRAIPTTAEAAPAAALALADLAALMMALPTLAEGRRCGRLAQDVRRLLKHQLVRYLPAAHAASPSKTIPR